jgi:hypothetical protein
MFIQFVIIHVEWLSVDCSSPAYDRDISYIMYTDADMCCDNLENIAHS